MAESGGGDGASATTPKSANTSLSLVEDYGCSDSESGDEAHGMDAEFTQEGELSEMVLKNNIINACAHGPLPEGSVDEARHIIIDSSGGGVIEYSVSEYREQDSDDSVSSDSSSEVNSVKDADEIDSSGEDDSLERDGGGRPVMPRVRGELTLDDLPPIEELTISVPSSEVSPVGKIFNIIDKLVIVQALPGTPAVDLESVLFLEKGQRALGKVFDVFGPVTEPHYCVRFNSMEQIREKKLELGMDVYIAPHTDHTSYVFVSQLMKMKGSDASWLNDIEPPPSQLEFSDDEEERRVKRERRRPAQQAAEQDGDSQPQPATRRPKPTRFEEQMNRRNLQRTAEANRFGNPPRFQNPFGGIRRPPPVPSQLPPPRPWGGTWPPPEEPLNCPPFMLARPMFNPYGPPGFVGPMGFASGRPHFPRMFNYGRSPRAQGFGQVMPWFTDNPPPPPPNT